MLTIGSVFSGIGGLELGLERAGMQVAWQVEIDDYARRILARHWPDVPKYGDIRACGAGRLHDLAPVDVLCGGFPCQPHSLAGRRGGAGDERDLWPEYRRLIGELSPRWVVAENVPGLLSTDAGRFFGGILRDLAALGYDAEWSVLSACAMGAPHTRERLFVVAYPTGQRGPWGRVRQDGARRDHASNLAAGSVESAFWQTDPHLVRGVADGLSRRVDKGKRLKALGNAVVPQVAERIGHMMMGHERKRKG